MSFQAELCEVEAQHNKVEESILMEFSYLNRSFESAFGLPQDDIYQKFYKEP